MLRTWIVPTFLLSAVAQLGVAPAAGQAVCDPEVRVTQEDTTFTYRSRGSRCEGMYGRDVGSRFGYHVVSYISDFEAYGRDDTLQVRWPSGAPSPRQIRADGIRALEAYRMDAALEPGDSIFLWPTAVLAGAEMEAAGLGVLAWAGSADDPVYVPLALTRGAPSAMGCPTLHVLTESDYGIEMVRVSIWQSSGADTTWVRQGEDLGYFAYGDVIDIDLNDVETPGEYSVRVALVEASLDESVPLSGSVDARIFHPGASAGCAAGGR